jgi:hypothetical protein
MSCWTKARALFLFGLSNLKLFANQKYYKYYCQTQVHSVYSPAIFHAALLARVFSFSTECISAPSLTP